MGLSIQKKGSRAIYIGGITSLGLRPSVSAAARNMPIFSICIAGTAILLTFGTIPGRMEFTRAQSRRPVFSASKNPLPDSSPAAVSSADKAPVMAMTYAPVQAAITSAQPHTKEDTRILPKGAQASRSSLGSALVSMSPTPAPSFQLNLADPAAWFLAAP